MMYAVYFMCARGEGYWDAAGADEGPFIVLLSFSQDRLTPIAGCTSPLFTLLGNKAKTPDCVRKKQRSRQKKTSLISLTHTHAYVHTLTHTRHYAQD